MAEMARRAEDAAAAAAAGQTEPTTLLAAYISSFATAATALNAAVEGVDKDAITDVATAEAEVTKLRAAGALPRSRSSARHQPTWRRPG